MSSTENFGIEVEIKPNVAPGQAKVDESLTKMEQHAAKTGDAMSRALGGGTVEAAAKMKAPLADVGKALDTVSLKAEEAAGKGGGGIMHLIKSMGELDLAMELGRKGIEFATSSFEMFERRAILSAATVGVSMDKLREASHGLVSDMDLMQIAAKGMGGRMKLTTDELDALLGSSVALEERGVMPLKEATEELSRVIMSGETRALKALGITYDETLAKTDKRAAIMQALTDLSHEHSSALDEETERIKQQGIELQNWKDRAEVAIGGLVHDTIGGFQIMNDKLLELRSGVVDLFKKDPELSWGSLILQQQWGLGLGAVQQMIDKFGELEAAEAHHAMLNGTGARAWISGTLEAGRQTGQADANADYLSEAKLAEQDAKAQKQLDDSAARAAKYAAAHKGPGNRNFGHGFSSDLLDDISKATSLNVEGFGSALAKVARSAEDAVTSVQKLYRIPPPPVGEWAKFGDMLKGPLSGALTGVIDQIASMTFDLKSLFRSLAEEIARAIIQMLLLQAIKASFSSTTGGVGGFLWDIAGGSKGGASARYAPGDPFGGGAGNAGGAVFREPVRSGGGGQSERQAPGGGHATKVIVVADMRAAALEALKTKDGENAVIAHVANNRGKLGR